MTNDPQLVQELIDSGLPPETHDRLGYCSVTAQEAKLRTGHKKKGWVVLYRDPDGKPYQHNGKDFYRLKPYGSKEGSPKYLSSAKAGCRPYFSPFFPKGHLGTEKDLFITEGEKKTDCLNLNHFPTIGLSGIWCWKDQRSGDSQPIPELEAINWKRQVYIVFDSDLTLKPQLQAALSKLCTWLANQAGHPFVPKVVQLPFERNGDKNGADDFIMRHGLEAYRRLVMIAQPSGKWKREDGKYFFAFTWTPEPIKNPHYIATPFSTVLKEHYAEHPSFGTYEWTGTHWSRMDDSKPLLRPIHDLMDAHDFHTRGDGRMSSIRNEIIAYLQTRKWDNPNLVAFANGTFDLTTYHLLPGHHSADYLTFCFPFNYEPEAMCPQWLTFIEKTYTTADGTPDPAVVNVLRAAFRWTICSKPVDAAFPYEVAFDVGGPKGCGKGVTSEVLRALNGGSHGVGTLRSKMFGDPDSLASLLNKKAAIDFDGSGIVTDPGCFNSIVSNEPVQIWIKYKNKCDARLGCVIWRFYNDQPRVADDGGIEGMSRRIITFSIPFSVSNKDPHLKQKLMEELPGIYQWAMSMSEVEMAQAFASAGEVESLGAASVDAQLDANPWLQFLIEIYPDGTTQIPALKLYERYREWCDSAGLKALNNTRFGRKLKRLGAYREILHKRSTKHCTLYEIKPLKDVDWADFFGMKCSGAGSSPPPVDRSEAYPPPPEQVYCSGSGPKVECMDSSRQPFLKGSMSAVFVPIERGSGNNPPYPPHPPPATCTGRVQAAMKAGCRHEEAILQWCDARNLSLSQSECRRVLKSLQEVEGSLNEQF